MYKESKIVKHSIIEYVLYIIASMIFAILMTFSPYKFITLQKDQILSLYTCEIQILIGCFTLITTVYIFYINSLDKVIDDDSNEEEGLAYLKQVFFNNLLNIFLTPLFLSVIIVLGIIFLDSEYDSCVFFFINCSITLLLFSLYSFIVYVTSALNPELPSEAVKEYDHNTIMSINKGNSKGILGVGDFLYSYNSIEYICKEIVDKVNDQYNNISFSICLKMLVQLEFIDNSQRTALNWLRVFRNAVVHSTERIEIDENLCKSVKEISVCFKENYEKLFVNGKTKFDRKEVNEIAYKFRNSINVVFINFYKLNIDFSNAKFY